VPSPFRTIKPIIGMLHVPALPGSPRNSMTFSAITDFVLADAAALTEGGADGLMLENFGDVPFFPSRVPAHTVAFLTALAMEVRASFSLPLGINVLRNDGLAAMAIAAAAGAAFVRVNVYTGARLADQGILQGEAYEITRFRKLLGGSPEIWADVAVKHSSSLSDRTLEDEVADTVERGLADAVIVSGTATGKPTAMEDLRRVKACAGGALVLVGSGADAANAGALLDVADGLIVGSALKRGGAVTAPVDVDRVRSLVSSAGRV
jgi:membrane complex biogenesis BtpA family protein